MNYYFTTTLNNTFFEAAREKAVEALKKEGFGVLTEIDIKSTFKKKLDVDFYKYTILGACNPQFAYKALLSEDNIGTMLPCNVILQEKEEGTIEISAVNPMLSMISVKNKSLEAIALDVSDKLKKVVNSL
jgi:uncharacterized protein (DUF302 family)